MDDNNSDIKSGSGRSNDFGDENQIRYINEIGSASAKELVGYLHSTDDKEFQFQMLQHIHYDILGHFAWVHADCAKAEVIAKWNELGVFRICMTMLNDSIKW